MRKAITPIIATVLLILMTVVSVAASFFWVTSVSSTLEENAGSQIGSNTLSACSRINFISMRGDEVVVQNTGCDTLTNITLLIDGVLTNYDLSAPLAPGDSAVISYGALSSGVRHCVSLFTLGGSNEICSSAEENTIEGGFIGEPVGNGNAWYETCGAGNTVVNWDNKLTFSQLDHLTCGCNSTLGTSNFVLNPGFEDDLTSWTVSDGGQTVISSTDSVHSGSKSVFIQSANPDLGVQPQVNQDLNNISYINFSINGSSAASGMYFAGILISYTFGSTQKSIYYLAYEKGLESFCNGPHPSDPTNTYIYCLSGFDNDVWGTTTVYPDKNAADNFGIDPAAYTKKLNLLVGGITQAYFDDIFIGSNSEGQYCDKDNSAGVADGICHNNNCADMYLRTFTNSNEFYNNENVPVRIELTNFAASPSCNLNINGANYAMILTSTEAYRTLTFLPSGSHLANVTCQGSNSWMSRTMNISSSAVKLNWTNTYPGTFADGNTNGYMTVGEFIPSNPGKEIIISGNESVMILSSNGTVLKTLSAALGDIDWDGYQFIDFRPLRLADVFGDGDNELFIQTSNHIYGFYNNYTLFMNISDNSFVTGALSISNISESPGLEIINTKSSNDVTAYASNGSILWHYNQAGSYGSYGYGQFAGSAIDDVNNDNSPELVFGEYGSITTPRGVRMLSSNGSFMFNYSLPAADPSESEPVTPVIADFDASSPGKEIAYPIFNSTLGSQLYIFDSNLSPLCAYNFSTAYILPYSPVAGDVNGDGKLEIVMFTENLDPGYDHRLWVINSSCSLILSFNGITSWDNRPILSEIDSTNPGLEFFTNMRSGCLTMLNQDGDILYSEKVNGQTLPYIYFQSSATSDVDNDGYVEILSANGNSLFLFRTLSTATDKTWPTFHQNNNNTGYLPD
ncbi:Repeat domain in Vibrio, Colwellia, Bradyrhizobium and Shewanella [uncultured archaeon]|nr:Repeat domain in Vibrio, Colwellia, Bradyrhizobium and Shewanella [uncultured archaeon]